MDTATRMAVDAFRKHEQDRRRADRSEAELNLALLSMDPDEFGLYFLHTEVIRFAEDRKVAQKAGDTETVAVCDRLLAEYHGKIEAWKTAANGTALRKPRARK